MNDRSAEITELMEDVEYFLSDAPETPSFGGPQARFAAASAGGSAEVTVAEITVSASVQGVFETE